MAETSEAEYARLAYEVAVYREQLKLLEREVQRVQMTNADLATAAQTCKSLQNSQGMVPIGGGAFVQATIQSSKALVPIGGNYLIEMDGDKAVVELEKRVEATKSATDKLREEYQKISQKLTEINQRLQQLQSTLRISQNVDENIREDYL